jgi:hypothetical protein
MKPSERIKEIASELTGSNLHPLDIQVLAIIKYLDEEYKNNLNPTSQPNLGSGDKE